MDPCFRRCTLSVLSCFRAGVEKLLQSRKNMLRGSDEMLCQERLLSAVSVHEML